MKQDDFHELEILDEGDVAKGEKIAPVLKASKKKEELKYYEKLYTGKLPIAFSVTPAIRMWNNGIPLKADPYRTCSNSCHYCFATAQSAGVQHRNGIKYSQRIIRYMKPNEILGLEKRMKANDGFTGWALKSRLTLEIGTLAEPFQETDRMIRTTWNLLQFCRENDIPMMFNTKGNLLIQDKEYFDLVVSHPAAVLMNVTIITTDEKASHKEEPFDSTPLERFKLIRDLRDKKIPSVIYFAPFMPGVSDIDVDKFVKMAYDYGAVGIHIRTFYITGKLMAMKRWKDYIKKYSDRMERHGYGFRVKNSYLLEVKSRMEEIASKLDSRFKIVGLKAELFEQNADIIHGRIPMDRAPKQFQDAVFDFTVIPILRAIAKNRSEPQLLKWSSIGHKEGKMNYPDYVYLTGEDEGSYMLSGGQRSPTAQSAGGGKRVMEGYQWVKAALWNGVMRPGYISTVSKVYPVYKDDKHLVDGNGDKVYAYVPDRIKQDFVTSTGEKKSVEYVKSDRTKDLIEPTRKGDKSDLYNPNAEPWYDEFDRWV